ncbi:MAG TPA: hypothetical protein DD438_13710 [Verrucomicrobiales bacterium]|nr:hypothetical protein [Verrucomicrobiales bacterium]|tara:strand:- start:1690 stop:2268 length:579 start_codon:yes stop_codon:yes gene_type:complete
MFSRSLVLLLLLCSPVLAVTLEVVELYQPLSLHRTDGVGETLGEEDPVQAGVFARPYAVTGAMPEDLVKAVAAPHRIATNSEGYEVEDANLLNLCGVALSSEMKVNRLLVRFDMGNFKLPEDLDLSARQVIQLSIIAVERTLRSYFRNFKDEVLSVSIGIIGTTDGNESLKELAKRFRLGRQAGGQRSGEGR